MGRTTFLVFVLAGFAAAAGCDDDGLPDAHCALTDFDEASCGNLASCGDDETCTLRPDARGEDTGGPPYAAFTCSEPDGCRDHRVGPSCSECPDGYVPFYSDNDGCGGGSSVTPTLIGCQPPACDAECDADQRCVLDGLTPTCACNDAYVALQGGGCDPKPFIENPSFHGCGGWNFDRTFRNHDYAEPQIGVGGGVLHLHTGFNPVTAMTLMNVPAADDVPHPALRVVLDGTAQAPLDFSGAGFQEVRLHGGPQTLDLCLGASGQRLFVISIADEFALSPTLVNGETVFDVAIDDLLLVSSEDCLEPAL